MTHIDLFTGIGGFALAAQWAGFKTVAFVEIEPYAQAIIRERFGAVADTECSKRWTAASAGQDSANGNDGRWAKEASRFEHGRPRLFSDIRTFDGSLYRGATLLTGGFPCQPFSQAGKRRGAEDDRYLWHEMLRVIRECQPAWILAENVDGLTSMVEFDSVLEVDDREYTRAEMAAGQASVGEVRERIGRGILHQIMEDLGAAGYAVQTFVIPAVAVDAKHRRDRVWIVGHADDAGRGKRRWAKPVRAEQSGAECGSETLADSDEFTGNRSVSQPNQRPVADGNGEGALHDTGLRSGKGQRNEIGGSEQQVGRKFESPMGLLADGLSAGLVQESDFCQWPQEPEIPRVATGVKNRVDQLKGLGNSIVPQVAYEILKVIAEIEMKSFPQTPPEAR